MSGQLSLLPGDTGAAGGSVSSMPARSRRDDPPTAKQAADSMTPMVLNRQRAEVLNVVKALYLTVHQGATAYDVHRSIGCQQSVAVRRCKDLEEMGLIRRTERTRPGSSGRSLIVWEPTDG